MTRRDEIREAMEAISGKLDFIQSTLAATATGQQMPPSDLDQKVDAIEARVDANEIQALTNKNDIRDIKQHLGLPV